MTPAGAPLLTDAVLLPFQAAEGLEVLQLLARLPLRHPGESPVRSCDLSRHPNPTRRLIGGRSAPPQELQEELDVHWPSLLGLNSSFHFWYDPTTMSEIHPPGKVDPGRPEYKTRTLRNTYHFNFCLTKKLLTDIYHQR